MLSAYFATTSGFKPGVVVLVFSKDEPPGSTGGNNYQDFELKTLSHPWSKELQRIAGKL